MRRDLAIDLPLPTSKNATHGYGRGRVYRSQEYQAWIKQADQLFLASGQNRSRTPIAGRFIAKVFVREGVKLDIQNIIDPILDWAQHAGIVTDDKHLCALTLSYGDIGNDCRLVIEDLA